ncbi:MAG: EAL domain-containing protein [Gordonibacter sp.]|uniref:EAL domain-containing protein n=2 Tax=Gordonibacter sp. TaxID=1968902 RepID=UPI002FC6C210
MKQHLKNFDVDAEFLFESMVAVSNDYIYVRDVEQDAAIVSPNMAADFGIEERVIGDFLKNYSSRVHTRDKARVLGLIHEINESNESCFAMEFQMRMAGDDYFWMRDSERIKRDPQTGKPLLIFGMLRNMERDENIDHVTGLLEFTRHKSQFERTLASLADFSGHLLLLGIDDFAIINTLNNHSFGDKVLRVIAQDILDMLPSGDALYRFEGDQFLAVIEGKTLNDVLNFYRRIKKYGMLPHQIDGQSYSFTVSAGAIAYPQQGNTWSDLEKGLSVALRKAKENGKNQCIEFTKELLEECLHEQMLGQRLGEGARNGFKGFRAVFQPVCLTKSLEVKGAEALMRFRGAKGVDVSPAEFIPLLESSQLILPVGMWMIEQAIIACKEWMTFIPDFVMNVNVSYVQLRDPSFCDKVEHLLLKYELDADNIILELTESRFISGDAAVNASLERLKALHIPLAMDDFGTGYSSLGRLAQFNVDLVKIDGLFVQALNRSRYNHDFVESVIRLCHNVGMKVCVEGVETREEQESVYLLNPDFVQGYYVSKPLEKDEFYRKFIQAPYDNESIAVNLGREKLQKQLVGDKELLYAMINVTPLSVILWNRDYEILTCNDETVQLFEALSQQDLIEHFYDFSPEKQPSGQLSRIGAIEKLQPAFMSGRTSFIWMHCTRKGDSIPAEVTAVRLPYQDDCIVASFARDLRTQLAVEEENQRFRGRLEALLDATPLCVNLWNVDLENIMCNQEAVKLFDLENEQEYLDCFESLSPKYQPDGRLSSEMSTEYIRAALKTGRIQFKWMHQKPTGELIPSEITLVRIDGLDAGDGVVAGYTRDLRSQLSFEQAQRITSSRIRSVMNASPLACLLWSLQGQLLDCNQVAVDLFGAKDVADVANNFDSFLPLYQPDGSNSLERKAASFKQAEEVGPLVFEWIYVNRNNEEIPCEVTVVRTVIEGAEEDIIVSYSRDLRELRKTLELNERLTRLANHDALTGCLSRACLVTKIETLFKTTKEEDLLSLTYLDLDAFKDVNDSYGHEAGDIALRSVVGILTEILPANALIGRFGGDEFVVVLQGVARRDVQTLLDNIVERVSNMTLWFGEESFSTSVSLGSAFRDSLDKRSKDMLRRADVALYEAKRQGRNRGIIAS